MGRRENHALPTRQAVPGAAGETLDGYAGPYQGRRPAVVATPAGMKTGPGATLAALSPGIKGGLTPLYAIASALSSAR